MHVSSLVATAALAVGNPLIGVGEGPGPRGALLRLDPSTLEPTARALPLPRRFVSDYEFSPSRRLVAVSDGVRNRVLLFDVRRWRSLGSVSLPGRRTSGYGGSGGTAWVSPRRLLVLAGPPFTSQTPVVVDPMRRRVVRRIRWRGSALTSDETRDGLLILAAPSDRRGRVRLGPARLVHAAVDGRVRSVRLDLIEAGDGRGDDGLRRVAYPGLAIDRRRNRAFVIATDRPLVAEVDLRTMRVAYHELMEPPAPAKGGPAESLSRIARWLGSRTIAVTGEDVSAPPQGRVRSVPYGLRLVDTRDWTIRTVDRRAQTFDVANGLLLARRWYTEQGPTPMGLVAYDLAGTRRWRRFSGSNAQPWAPGGDRLYVDVGDHGERRTHVVDRRSGRTLDVLPTGG